MEGLLALVLLLVKALIKKAFKNTYIKRFNPVLAAKASVMYNIYKKNIIPVYTANIADHLITVEYCNIDSMSGEYFMLTILWLIKCFFDLCMICINIQLNYKAHYSVQFMLPESELIQWH